MYHILTIQPTCHDGIQNHGETAIDKGGPCLVLNEADLLPYSIVWSRSFPVRDGTYNAVAYVQNPNNDAGVLQANYVFRLYDEQHVLLAERTGSTYLMPGGVTPIFEDRIPTGQRVAAHTSFEFTNKPFVWEKMHSMLSHITVSGLLLSNSATMPLLKAKLTNNGPSNSPDLSVVAVVFDTTGNAINASATLIPSLSPYTTQDIVFTWPLPFSLVVGSTDVLPRAEPELDPTAER